MRFFGKKPSPRRDQVRKNIAAERSSQISELLNTDRLISVLLWLLFVALCTPVLSFELVQQVDYLQVISMTVIVVLVSLAAVFYIHHYQRRIVRNYTRALALAGLFILLLAATKLGVLLTEHTWWATGTAITAAIILTIAYNQRFAIGMSMFYCVFACFAAGPKADIKLFLTMAAGVITCCFLLKEIRTRMKLLKVSTLTALIVFIIALALDFLAQTAQVTDIFRNAGFHAGATLAVGMLIQSLLPLIEKIFRIATSMTLLDYSDANQPLLKKLAMEAPGTFSHSLLIGSIAEAAAEVIGRNGLLCRVGAYYHDIGKINKPNYFVENQMGSIVMLADSVEGAVRSLGEATPTRIEAVVHNMAMKRLQDGQFDECDLSLRELSQIETSISKTLAAHYHGRIAYPKPPDVPEAPALQKERKAETPEQIQSRPEQIEQKKQ